MAYDLSSFHEALRALIGDGGSLATGYDYMDEQLDGALRTVVKMGFVPCLALEDEASLVAAPANADTWAFLVAKAAHVFYGGANPVNIRTRAISVTQEAAARRDSLSWIETMLSDIDARGNVCGTAADTGHKGLFGAVGDVVTYCQVFGRGRCL